MILVIVLIMLVLFTRNYFSHQLKHIDVTDLKTIMEPYSGYNPDAYVSYVNNIQMMANSIENINVAQEFLSKALINIDDISFNADFEQDDIYEIRKHVEAESISLMLRYLNN